MMNIVVILSLIIILTTGIESFSQNLVANGSFEDENICKEFKAPCAPSAWKTTSPFLMEYGSEKSNKFVEITIFNTSKSGSRQYLQTRLLCQLQKDIIYKFSIRLKAENLIIGSMGVLFSDSAAFYDTDKLIKKTPTIDLEDQYSGIPIQKRKSWVKIETEYRASGREKYMIIGNFQTDEDQKRTFLTKPTPFTKYECDIDDIELTPKIKTDICPDFQLTKDLLYSLTERHPFKKDNIFGENSSVKRMPDKPGIDTLSFGSVFFEFNSSKINSAGKQTIDSLLGNIKKENIESIKIYGFTDSKGDKDYNLELSARRAEAIKKILVDWKFPPYMIEVNGFGYSFPIADNSDEAGRTKNRRVEVIIKYKVSSDM
jgi:outer membrane protein OmpA-like peptidoglycan-associated protein